MADDLTKIRDSFIEQAKKLGLNVQEKPPAKGYRYTADVFDGEERIGRLYMRKTTVSWKAAGAQSVVRLSGSEDVAGLLSKSRKKPPAQSSEDETESSTKDTTGKTPVAMESDESDAEKKSKKAESVELEEEADKSKTKAKQKVKADKTGTIREKEKARKTKEEKITEERKEEAVGEIEKKREVKEADTEKKEENGEGVGEDREETKKTDEEEVPEAVEEEKEEKPISSLSRAVSEFKSGNFEKALQWARLSLAENPDSAAARDILHRAERLLSERKEESPPSRKITDKSIADRAITPEQSEHDFRIQHETEKRTPQTKAYPPKTTPPAHKPESQFPAAPLQPKVRPESVAAPTKSKKPERGARIPLWAVVAFVGLVTAVVYLWPGNRDGGDARDGKDRIAVPPEVTIDPVETLQTHIAILEEQLEADTSGVSTAELMRALIELGTLEEVDERLMERIRTLAIRADSLAVISSRHNHLDKALSFLDEAKNGWAALETYAGEDSLVSERIDWNAGYRVVIASRNGLLKSMVLIPAGTFTRGSDRGFFESQPAAKVTLSAYYISKYEITNRQYHAFLYDTGHEAPLARNRYQEPYGWTGSEFPEGKGDYPVVLVDWNDAHDFAQWFGGSLPSEAQWEKAARGTDGRDYPWGNQFRSDSLVCREGGGEYSPVGYKSGDTSPYGVKDMAGNVREWVQDWYGSDYYLTRSSRQNDPEGPNGGRFRVIRGASWRTEGEVNGLTHGRENAEPWMRSFDLGFRLVMPDSVFQDLSVLD